MLNPPNAPLLSHTRYPPEVVCSDQTRTFSPPPQVSVFVTGAGYSPDAGVTFHMQLETTAVSPQTSNDMGGLELTLTGAGFSTSLAQV